MATRTLHRDLDRHRVLTPLLGASVTLAQYQRALLAMHTVTGPVEDRIGHYVETQLLPFDYAAHRRVPDLSQDIRYFGLTPPEPAWDGMPITSIGVLIGCLYVLEGSAMGGRVIFHRINKSLGVSALHGGRFFSCEGRRTDELWLDFWRFATTHCQPEDVSEACCAGSALFGAYIDLLGQYDGSPR